MITMERGVIYKELSGHVALLESKNIYHLLLIWELYNKCKFTKIGYMNERIRINLL